jgi:DNA-binding MarR family transcriptional regulator
MSVKKQPRKTKKSGSFPPSSTSLKPFLVNGRDHDFRKMIYGLLQVSSMMLKAREYYGAYIGVSAPQYSMIVAIAEAGEATVRDLTKIMHVSSPFVTAEVNKLIAAGYLQKRPNTKDRRSIVLSLTAAGEEAVLRVAKMRLTANDMIFGSITNEEAKVFQHLIQVLITDFGRAIHELEAPHWWKDGETGAN